MIAVAVAVAAAVVASAAVAAASAAQRIYDDGDVAAFIIVLECRGWCWLFKSNGVMCVVGVKCWYWYA